MLADGVICVLSGFVFGSIDNALYSFFTLWVFSKTLDMMLYGGDRGKLALIISPAADKILHRLLNEGNLGCTVIKARTGYTGEDRDRSYTLRSEKTQDNGCSQDSIGN